MFVVAEQSDLDYEDLAQLLQDIADKGALAFYNGTVARDIVNKVSLNSRHLLSVKDKNLIMSKWYSDYLH